MANPVPNSPDVKDFEAKGLRALDVMIARGAEKVDLGEARDIGLISEEAKARIEAQLPQHETLFAQAYERESAGGDRAAAFKRAFSIVYGRFQMEDREGIGADPAVIGKINSHLEVPVAATENLAKGDPALAGALRRLRARKAAGGTKGRAFNSKWEAKAAMPALLRARDEAVIDEEAAVDDVAFVPGLDRRSDVARRFQAMEEEGRDMVVLPMGMFAPQVQSMSNGDFNKATLDAQMQAADAKVAGKDKVSDKFNLYVTGFSGDFDSDYKAVMSELSPVLRGGAGLNPADELDFLSIFSATRLERFQQLNPKTVTALREFVDVDLKYAFDGIDTLKNALPPGSSFPALKKMEASLEKFRDKVVDMEKKLEKKLKASEDRRNELVGRLNQWEENYREMNGDFGMLANASTTLITPEQMARMPELQPVLTEFKAKYDVFAVIDPNVVTLDQLKEMSNAYAAAMVEVDRVSNEYLNNARGALAGAESKVSASASSIDALGALAGDTTTKLTVDEILGRAFAAHPKVGDITEKRRKMTEAEDAANDALKVYNYAKDGRNFTTLTNAAKSYRQAVADCGLGAGTDYLKALRQANLQLKTAENAKINLDRKPPTESDVIAKFKAEVGSVEPDLGTVDKRQSELDSGVDNDVAKLQSDIDEIKVKKDKLKPPSLDDAKVLLAGAGPSSVDVDSEFDMLMSVYNEKIAIIESKRIGLAMPTFDSVWDELKVKNGGLDPSKKEVDVEFQKQRAEYELKMEALLNEARAIPVPTIDDAIFEWERTHDSVEPDPQAVREKFDKMKAEYQNSCESFDKDIEAKRQAKRNLKRRTRAEVVTLIKTETMNAALAPSAVQAELEKLKLAYKADMVEADDNIEKAQAVVGKLNTVFAKAGVMQKALGPFLENIQAAQSVGIPLDDIFGANAVSTILDPDSMRIAMDSANGDQGSSAFDPEKVQAYALEIANFIDGEVEFEGTKMKKIEALKRAFDKKIEERESERDAAKKAYEDAKLLAEGSKDLSRTEAARRIVRAMVDEDYPELDDDEKKRRVELILAEDVELARTEMGYRELAERGSEALLNTVSNSALKSMLGLKYTVQGQEKPFEPLKIFSAEDFSSNQNIDALFGRGGAAGKVTLKNGFFALAALKRSGAEGTDSLQAAHFARKLRAMLAEELGATEAMAEVSVQKKVAEVFKTQLEAADFVVQSYTTHQLSKQEEVDKSKIREFNLRYKVLKEKRRTGDLDHYNYKRQLSLLVKEVKDAGLENKVDFSCDTAFAEYWNSKQAQWVRDLGKNVGKFGGKMVLGAAGGVLDVGAGMALGGAKLALETTGRLGLGVAKSAVRNLFRPLIGFRNLFFKNKWTPIPSITDGVKEGVSNVLGYLGRKKSEAWEGTKAKTGSAWKDHISGVKFERKHYKDNRKDVAPLEAEIAEVAKAGVMPALELGGDPVMDLTKFKGEIEKLVKAAAPKVAATKVEESKSDTPKAA